MALYATSLVSSAIALLMGAKQIGTWLGVPGLVMAGWAFIGQLVTLDDDMPGGWSNPQESAAVWKSSLRELFVKLACFLVISVVVLSQMLF